MTSSSVRLRKAPARILEVNSLSFLLINDGKERENVSRFITEIHREGRDALMFFGERYAIGLVWTVLAVLYSQKRTGATKLVKLNLICVCDRMERGIWIAST